MFTNFALFMRHERYKSREHYVVMIREEQIITEGITHIKEVLPQLDICCNTGNSIITINGIDFVVIVKTSIKRGSYLMVLNEMNRKRMDTAMPIILVCDYVSSEVLKEFTKDSRNILESSGNCYISEGQLMLYISGMKHKQVNERIGKAFNETGIKLLFYFLSNKVNISKSYRTISEDTGISLGAITNIIEELKSQHYVAMRSGKRMLINRIELLNQWQQSFNKTLKPKLLLGRMKFRDEELKEQWENMEMPDNSYWAGENAAYKADGFLHPEQFTIYTDKRITDFIRSGKLQVDPNGDVFVYKTFWNNESENGNEIVNNILTYADLMGSGLSRCLEAAQRILPNAL